MQMTYAAVSSWIDEFRDARGEEMRGKQYDGGEGGIRTPDTLLGCNCLAGSPVRPLQHLSAGLIGRSVYFTLSRFSIGRPCRIGDRAAARLRLSLKRFAR